MCARMTLPNHKLYTLLNCRTMSHVFLNCKVVDTHWRHIPLTSSSPVYAQIKSRNKGHTARGRIRRCEGNALKACVCQAWCRDWLVSEGSQVSMTWPWIAASPLTVFTVCATMRVQRQAAYVRISMRIQTLTWPPKVMPTVLACCGRILCVMYAVVKPGVASGRPDPRVTPPAAVGSA